MQPFVNQQKTLQSLTKGLNILKLFSSGKGELSLTEISELLDLNRPTAFRLIATLTELGFLSRKEKKGKYILGPIFYDFYRFIKNGMSFRNIIAPYLIQLSQRVNEATTLVLGNGSEELYSETFYNWNTPDSPLGIVRDPNTRTPLYKTSVGKVILANMSEEQLNFYFNNIKLERSTPNTITDLTVLKNQLIIVKQEGIAFDDEEFCLGVRSLASGIEDGEGQVIGAIGITAPSVRLPDSRLQELVIKVKNCAVEISGDISTTIKGQKSSGKSH